MRLVVVLRKGFTVRKLFIISGLVFVSLASPQLSAKEVRYKDYLFEVQSGDRLAFAGLKAAVKLVPGTDGRRGVLRVRKTISDKAGGGEMAKFDALSFNLRREGSTILVEVKGPDGKAQLAQWMKQGSPDISFEVELPPAVPVEISLNDGQVTASNWHQPLAVNLVSGSLKTSGTDGLLRLQIQRGSVSIERHRGALLVDSFAAKLSLQEVEGDLTVTNFSGETAIQRAKGSLELTASQGNTIVAKSAGSIEFNNGHGHLSATGFEGPIKGQTEQGAVSVALEGEADADVRIESNQGGVTVKLPTNSGSLVRMQSEEGVLTPPETIKPSGGHAKLISNRLPGSGPKGTVSLKSKAGNLRVKL